MTIIIFDNFSILLTNQNSCDSDIELKYFYYAKDLFDFDVDNINLEVHIKINGTKWNFRAGTIPGYLVYDQQTNIFSIYQDDHIYKFNYTIVSPSDTIQYLGDRLTTTMSLIRSMASEMWLYNNIRVVDDTIYYTYHDNKLQKPLPYPCVVEKLVLSSCYNIIIIDDHTIYDLSNVSMLKAGLAMIKKNNWNKVKTIVIEPPYSSCLEEVIPDSVRQTLIEIKNNKLSDEQIETLKSYNVVLSNPNVSALIQIGDDQGIKLNCINLDLFEG